MSETETQPPEASPNPEADATAAAAFDKDQEKQALAALANGDPGRNIDSLMSVQLDVRVVLGRSRMPIMDLLELTRGSVIELDRKVGDPVDIMINDRMVARGDLVKVNGDLVGVALREIIKDFVPGS